MAFASSSAAPRAAAASGGDAPADACHGRRMRMHRIAAVSAFVAVACSFGNMLLMALAVHGDVGRLFSLPSLHDVAGSDRAVLVASMVVDVALAWLDPRMRATA